MFEKSAEFWAQRDAWRSEVAAKVGGKRAAWSIVAIETRWALRADHYLRRLPQVRAAVAFNSSAMNAAIRENLERVGPELAASFDEHLPAVADLAFKSWPVKSGYSKGSINLYYREDGDGKFAGGIAVTAPYATLIQGRPASTLIDAPLKAQAPAVFAAFFRRMSAKAP